MGATLTEPRLQLAVKYANLSVDESLPSPVADRCPQTAAKLAVPAFTVLFISQGVSIHVPPHQSSSIPADNRRHRHRLWVAGGVRAQESKSPNEKIAMASIGLGGKGSSDSSDAGNAGDMVAICDVDEDTLNNAGEKRFPKAKRYTDFRKMLDEMGKSIDAVTVSTPDHNHAPAALMAMRMGKHCFCQKPLTHSIYEARLMAQVAREMKVATQMGNQGTAFSPLRKAAAIIKSGALGPVKEVHVWTNRPIWPQGGDRPKSVAVSVASELEPLARTGARSGPMPTAIIRSPGAAGGISAPAPWATWPATP